MGQRHTDAHASAVESPRALRRDAAANRERIIAAARQVFAEHGVDVALSEIAKQADLGLATLTRRFNRTELVEAVLIDRTDEHLGLLDEALQQPASECVAAYLEALCTKQLNDRSVCHALTLTLPDASEVLAHRSAIREAQLRLIRRARRAGALRPGIVPEDFVSVLEAVNGVIRSSSPGSWRRVLALLVDGLKNTASAQDLPPAPTVEEVQQPLKGPARGRKISPIKAG